MVIRALPLPRTRPVAATAYLLTVLADVYDKGFGVLGGRETRITDAENGQLFEIASMWPFAQGIGGFGPPKGAS